MEVCTVGTYGKFPQYGRMDPWGVGESDKQQKGDKDDKFEDNFSPAVRDTLPDSDQYLATLEKKLREIKNDPNVLKQLAEKREACMQNLLNGETQFEESDGLDSPVGQSHLLRTILPQKQALNKGEVVELVNYDQLNSSESEGENVETD